MFLVDKPLAQSNFFYKYFRSFLAMCARGGWVGVDLFFVLSGFLVSGLLMNEYKKSKDIQYGKFLIRRGFKIYPGFVFLILSTFLIETCQAHTFHTHVYPVSAYLKDLFFLHNYLPGRWSITWSLDVEEAFYFLLTLFFYIYIRKNKLTLRVLVITYFTLLVFGMIGRMYANHLQPDYEPYSQFMQTHIRLDALFLGVVLSWLYHFKQEALLSFFSTYKKVLIPLSILIITPNFLFPKAENHYWLSVYMLAVNPPAFGCLLLACMQSKLTFFNNKALSFIGKNSYSIYLWHQVVNGYLHDWLPIETSMKVFLLYIPVYMLVSVLVGVIATRLIEEPFLKLRNRLYPSPVKNAVTTG